MNKEYFWSIVLEPNVVQAAIWTIEGKSARLVAVGSPAGWEDKSDMVGASDNALTTAIHGFPEDQKEPEKVVFGVPPSWVGDGQIKKEYLADIKEICSKLKLVPTGFVVLPEAIAHEEKVSGGAPLSGIVVGISNKELDISLFRLGNLVGTVNVGRSVSLVDDVVEGVTRFGDDEALPSRIIIYDGKRVELDEAEQTLLAADWEINFLHTPKVEIVPPEKKMLAVSLAGASEIGEVEGVKKELPSETENVSEAGPEVTPESLGFSVGGQKDGKIAGLKRKLGRIKFRGVRRIFPISLPIPTAGPKPLMLFAVSLIAIFSVLFAFLWFVPKADVAVFVSPKVLEGDEAITIEEGLSSPKPGEGVLAGKKTETAVSGEKTISTTGSKKVGERASGTVTVRNGTSSGVRLEQGMKIVGTNGLSFETTEEASVSAAVSPAEPGTVSMQVQAEAIGAEYNLAEGEVFTVSNFPRSELDAIAQSDFTGGSSKQIVAVSQSDIDGLDGELRGELLVKAKKDLEKQAQENSLLIEETENFEVLEANFSAEVGDEASSLELAMDIEIAALAVERSQIEEFIREKVKSSVPEGFVLSSSPPELRFDLIDEDGGVWEFDLHYSVNLLPSVDSSEIASAIKGKSIKDAERILSNIPGNDNVQIRLRPPLPSFFENVPRNKKNITVEIVAER